MIGIVHAHVAVSRIITDVVTNELGSFGGQHGPLEGSDIGGESGVSKRIPLDACQYSKLICGNQDIRKHIQTSWPQPFDEC